MNYHHQPDHADLGSVWGVVSDRDTVRLPAGAQKDIIVAAAAV